MNLSQEDSLRLNIMLVSAIAIKIDEGTMMVQGLLKNGKESCIKLNPNCHCDQYTRYVRELLSSAILGSPGGYPVFLKRWTRMGQTSDAVRLENLLKLGEPEACIAVTGSSYLTDELAERAWWIMPSADNARSMLRHAAVAEGSMGKTLAEFLLEFLPFEQEPKAIIESVSLILQPGLIDDATKQAIWDRGDKKGVFRLGFLKAIPDELPAFKEARDVTYDLQKLKTLSNKGNVFSRQLLRIYSQQGQSYLNVCEGILRKPSNQDTVVSLLNVIVAYLAKIRLFDLSYTDVESIEKNVTDVMSNDQQIESSMALAINELLKACPDVRDDLYAILVLAHTNVTIVNPIFSRTDANGSVMRKKIEPISRPINRYLRTLQGL